MSAKDKASNRTQNIVIQGTSNLTEEDIGTMIKSAEKFTKEDKKRKELIESQNAANAALHKVNRLLSEINQNIDTQMKHDIEETVEKLENSLQNEDINMIKDFSSKLQTYLDQLLIMQSDENNTQNQSENQETKITDDEDNIVDGDLSEE